MGILGSKTMRFSTRWAAGVGGPAAAITTFVAPFAHAAGASNGEILLAGGGPTVALALAAKLIAAHWDTEVGYQSKTEQAAAALTNAETAEARATEAEARYAQAKADGKLDKLDELEA